MVCHPVDRHLVLGPILEVLTSTLRPKLTDPGRDAGSSLAEQPVQVADRNVVGRGNRPRRQLRIGKPIVDVIIDALHQFRSARPW